MRGLKLVGMQVSVKMYQALVFKLCPAQTFGHPRNMFLDFVKQSSTICEILYYIVFSAHILREDM